MKFIAEVEPMPIQVMNSLILDLSKLLVNEIKSDQNLDNNDFVPSFVLNNQNEQRIVH